MSVRLWVMLHVKPARATPSNELVVYVEPVEGALANVSKYWTAAILLDTVALLDADAAALLDTIALLDADAAALLAPEWLEDEELVDSEAVEEDAEVDDEPSLDDDEITTCGTSSSPHPAPKARTDTKASPANTRTAYCMN